MKTHRRAIALGLLIAAALVLAGCNTVSGMGKDLTAASSKTAEWFGAGTEE